MALKVLRKEYSAKDEGECSDKRKSTGLWKLAWQLKCPNKIKDFLWRACKNIIPTNLCLASRSVASNNSCVSCGGCESSGHALWDCYVAAEVWREVGVNLPVLKQPMKNFVDVVWSFKERDGVSDWELFAITAWMIWNNRNVFKHEERGKDPKRIAMEAREYAKEVAEVPQAPCCSQVPVKSFWRPPQLGSFKINVDGAMFTNLKSCGIGVVIRNEVGQIMGALSRNLPFPLGVLEVEAKAIEEGINLARDLGLWEVEIESDAQVVVKAITDAASCPSFILKVVEGINVGLGSLRRWSVKHTSRQTNFAAHIMAREARCLHECHVWVEDTPPVIAIQVQLDVNRVDILS